MTDSIHRLVRSITVLVCIAAMAVHLAGLRRETIQLDEFEHVHAAWLVSQGQTPYTDFFQHHTPLFYYLAGLLLPGMREGFDAILDLRFVMLLFSVFSVAAGWRWLRGYGRIHGLLAVCLLASNSTFLSLGHTIFLDTASVPFLVVSAMLMAGGNRKPRWMLGAGLCFGFAVLINLKASMAVFAPIVLMASRGWDARRDRLRRRGWLTDNAAYLAGGLLSILFVVALLGRAGSADMWRYCVELNLGWKARMSGVPTMLRIFWREFFVTCAVAALIATRAWTLARRGWLIEGRDVPGLFFLSLLAGVFILPVVWLEYFAMMIPFLALAGAVALGDWLTGLEEQPAVPMKALAGLALFGLLAVAPYRVILRSDPLALWQASMMLAFTAMLLTAARACLDRADLALPVTLCLALAGVVPLVRVATLLHREDNSAQRRQLEYVMANTRSSDAVFDGYTGYGVFRPHAYYYWMIHQEVQAMLSERDKGERLIAALESKRPPIAIADDWVAMLPRQVQTYLAEHYEEAAPPFPVFRKRRTLPGEASATLRSVR